MAFNWQTFKTRSLTAAVFVLLMLSGLLWNQWSFLVLFSVIHFGCWWEYLKLTEKIYATQFHINTKLGLMLMGYSMMLWSCGDIFSLFGYAIRDNFSMPVSVAGFILTIIGIFRQGPVHLHSFGMCLLGFFYISMSWGMMMGLYQSTELYLGDTVFVFDKAFYIPVLIIAAIWINDTMAYIVGSMIGKNPLSKWSPKKTWEGTIGGVILAVVVAGLLFPYLLWGKVPLSAFLFAGSLALLAAVTGTFGDLLESKLKRMAGVKDSGSLMPGHGGFLDRFDSLLLATPFVWLYINFVN